MLRRHAFLLGLLAVAVLGWRWPAFGVALARSPFAVPALVALTLFIAGLTIDARRLAVQATNGRALAVTLVGAYGLAPALAWAAGRLLVDGALVPPPLAGWLAAGLVLAATQAGTLASAIAYTLAAGGDRELAVALTLVSNALSVVLTPALLALMLAAEVALPMGEMMQRLALMVLLPVVAGQAVRRGLGYVPGARGVLRRAPQAVVLLFVHAGLASAAHGATLAPAPLLMTATACLLVHGLTLAAAHAAARGLGLSPGECTAAAFCGAQKTLPNGMFLWQAYFAGNPLAPLVLVVFHLGQLLVDAVVLPYLAPARARARPAPGR